MARIMFIRHGQAAFGSSRYDSLTDLGKSQSEALGGHLKACGVTFDRVASGEMVRQRETARLALASMDSQPPVAILSAFNEYDHMGIIGAARPLIAQSDSHLVSELDAHFSNRRFQSFFEKAMSLWMGGMPLPEGVETFSTFSGRVRSGVQGLAGTLGAGETAAVFSSGGAIAMALGLALALSPRESMNLSWFITNGSYSILHAGKKRLSLMNANVSAHLAVMGKGWVTYR